MNRTLKDSFYALVLITGIAAAQAGPLIVDHNDIDITTLTEAEINRAKSVLHIGYGHTSHGSQITDGMSGLVGFANGGGLGLSLPNDIFAWNNGGTGGALDLEEGAGYSSGWLELDGGYWPTWYNETIEYLNDPTHADVNVIMWSWCGQMDDKYAAGTLSNEYLLPMSSLETSYPDVVFVYMTGHVPDAGSMSASLDNRTKEACQAIRDYCIANDKVFFDFNDIEHYNPDGTYFEFVTDNCDYYATNGGSASGNWATEWRAAHTENFDWYSCGSAHSDVLNANMKAYAIWRLWCELGADLDRDDIHDEWEERYGGCGLFDGGTNDCDGDGVTDYEEYVADTVPTNNQSQLRLQGISTSNACELSFPCSTARVYSLEYSSDPCSALWSGTPGATNISGEADGTLTLCDTNDAAFRIYRVGAALPQ